ncbi:MAG: hypothetical protein N3B13_11005, partial [Deltaproteobacteria bacterium]|nr:hypothetical protein [Deltaproteobacteria bacterium]
RCKMFVHIVAYNPDRDIIQDIDDINYELKMYKPELLRRPQIIAINKIDLAEDKDSLSKLISEVRARKKRYKIIPISGITREGIKELLKTIAVTLIRLREKENEKRRTG